MKKVMIIALLALTAACAPRQQDLRTGDLVFMGIPNDYSLGEDSMDGAIASATGAGSENVRR